MKSEIQITHRYISEIEIDDKILLHNFQKYCLPPSRDFDFMNFSAPSILILLTVNFRNDGNQYGTGFIERHPGSHFYNVEHYQYYKSLTIHVLM